MRKIKISFIGLGRVFNHYIYILEKFKLYKFIEIDCLCDAEKSVIKKIKKKIKAKFFLSIDEFLLNCSSDIIFILTPSGMHYQHCLHVIKKKFNVITEKPLTMTYAEGMRLKKIAKKNKIVYGVVFQNRFNPAIQYVKKILKKKLIGKITNFSVRIMWCRYQGYYNDKWHGKWKDDGGVLNQQAIHHLDTLNWLIGPIKEVFANCSNQLNKLEAEDTIAAILKLNSNAIGTFHATTAARPKDISAEIAIFGSKGYLEVSGSALNELKKVNLNNREYSKKFLEKYSEKVLNGYGFGHAKFIKSICQNFIKKGKIITPVSANEGIINTSLVHSLYKSNETNKWQKIDKNNKSKYLGKKSNDRK